MSEKFFIPSIAKDQIGPKIGLSQERTEQQAERREAGDSLSHYIFKWWRGDAHTHSKESTRAGYNYAEGIYNLEEIMDYYKSLGLEFVCFTEHASQPGSPKRQNIDSDISQSLLGEAARINQMNRERKDIMALSGVEANILFDEHNQPILDLPDDILQKLDLVIASRHSIDQEKEVEAIKDSLLCAIKNPHVDVIGHPDRYTREDQEKSTKEAKEQYWQAYWNIWPEILQEMVNNNKAFEINLNCPPAKKLIEMAALSGVKFFINYDAHDFNQYKKEETELTKSGEKAKEKWSKGEDSEEISEILKEYKTERLSAGPGYKAISVLVRWLKRLESLEVTPARVVNSSRKNLLDFLTEDRGKKTENLDFLQSV